MSGFKTITMSPLNGLLDVRSTSDLQVAGAFAWKQNMEVSPDGKLRQAKGFTRPWAVTPIQSVNGTLCPYANWDFHNQGVATASREPVTKMFQSFSNDGVRQLFITTKTRIFKLNESTGAYTQLGGTFGADGSGSATSLRWQVAELQNKVFFTNDFDQVQVHTLGTNAIGPVTSLQTAGSDGVGHQASISKAAIILQHQGVIMLMNVVENGKRMASRIWWSDLNKGDQFNQPYISTISDYQDLDYSEEILNAKQLGNYVYVFTNKSIWRCNFSVDQSNSQAVLNCTKIYTEPSNQAKCLAYPNTLASDGFSIFYAAKDSIYTLNPYLPQPERTEWIYRAAGIAFDAGLLQLDAASKKSVTMEFLPATNELWFSWPVVDAKVVNWNSCSTPPTPPTTGINRHTLVFNVTYSTADYRDHGFASFVNYNPNSVGSAGDGGTMFMACSSEDFCIKLLAPHNHYAREIYNPALDAYFNVGYTPKIRGVFPFGKFDTDKQIKSFTIDGFVERDAGNFFNLRIGTSYQQMNPNSDMAGCGVIWNNLLPRPIKCLYNDTKANYRQRNIRPAYDHKFNFLHRGRFLYYELWMADAAGKPPVGGGVTISRLEVQAIET